MRGNEKLPVHQCIQVFKAASKSNGSKKIHPDSLDLSLAGVYDHHNQWLVDKFNVLKQPSFWNGCHRCTAFDHNRCKVKRGKGALEEVEKYSQSPPTIYQEKFRDTTHHLKINMTSTHLPSSVRGFGKYN